MNTLIASLQNPNIYPHRVTQIDVIETHLSWVILTGDYAYKIKKPLNLGFQDFSTLEKRHYYCELEISLNQLLAPSIYISVIPITGTPEDPQLDGKGEPIEYAIKMLQFPQENLLNAWAKAKKLTPSVIKNIAKQIADFHQNAPSDTRSSLGTPAQVLSPMLDNFKDLKPLSIAAIATIEEWVKTQAKQLEPLLAKRKGQGFIRACHGDLHCGNIVLINQMPVIFDCIEFNESFRWTDVFNDLAFLTMDLEHFNLNDLSHLLLNQYLEHTGDYDGVLLLKFYQSYRAMVRAKITAIQIHQLSDKAPTALQQDLENLIHLAYAYTQPQTPQLTITFGLSGSGKTVYTEQLLMQTGAIRLRADVIRKQLKVSKDTLYSEKTTRSVYEKLQLLAKKLLQAGFAVIIDATCLKQWQRQLFFDLAHQLNLDLQILAFETPIEILRQRIVQRMTTQHDASDADEAVLALQINSLEPLTYQEKNDAKITLIEKK